MRLLQRAFGFFLPNKGRIALIFILMLFSLALNILKPWPLALIVDSVLGGKLFPKPLSLLADDPKAAQLAILVAALFILYLSHAVFSSAQMFVAIDVGLRGLARVRNEVFGWLQRLSLRFHHRHRVGDLIYRAGTDTYSFQTVFQQGMVALAASLLSLLFIMAVMWRVNRPLTFIALGVLPLLVLTMRYFGATMRRRGLKAQKAESAVTSLVQQGIVALPLTQSYTREEHEEDRFHAEVARARASRLSQHGWEVLYGLMVSLCLALGTAAITWSGAQQVMSGKLTIGELLVFLAYLTQMFEPLNQLTHVGSTLANANAGLRRVFEILDTPDEVRDRPQARSVISSRRSSRLPEKPRAGTPAPLVVKGGLTFENVFFSYNEPYAADAPFPPTPDTRHPVLHEVSFQIEAGESVAVIGPSGAGKTTLLNLLPRFFDPTSGVVRLDGIDLRDLRVRDVRAQMALLLQEPIILATTVAENISYGHPGAGKKEIEAAARAAHAHDFIQKLPQGYHTFLGEGGAGLSVGEKQRINLARSFLKNAPILLLDEPTSALDSESESMIVESLKGLMKERTTVMVAHRLSTIKGVDKILVLDQGHLVELGSPAELLQRDGYYARVVNGQTQLG